MRGEADTVRRDESAHPKEQRERKMQEVEAADLGLKIYAATAK